MLFSIGAFCITFIIVLISASFKLFENLSVVNLNSLISYILLGASNKSTIYLEFGTPSRYLLYLSDTPPDISSKNS